MVDLDKVPSGRDKQSTVEPILLSLYELLKGYPRLKTRLENTKSSVLTAVKPESITGVRFLV